MTWRPSTPSCSMSMSATDSISPSCKTRYPNRMRSPS